MTAATLRTHTAKDLARIARKEGISGWHSMRKEELIRALLRLSRRRIVDQNKVARAETREATTPNRRLVVEKQTPSNGNVPKNQAPEKRALGKQSSPTTQPESSTDSRIRRKIDQLQSKLSALKNLASDPITGSQPRSRKDRLAILVRDPYWLHATWELSQSSVGRARAALGQRWHQAQPVLRVFQLSADNSTVQLRDIIIHGGVTNWYVDVQNPPNKFRMEIGYLADDQFFYCMARSNTVSTPPAGTSDAVDNNWADVAQHADRIYAMSGGYSHQGISRELQELLEQRLRRPMGSPMKTRYGAGAAVFGKTQDMQFAVDAEVIVYGAVDRGSHVTLKGEPVQVRNDGTFTVRLSLPERRQVIPIVASSSDGVEQRTVILAIERNTKVMEPVVRDISS